MEFAEVHPDFVKCSEQIEPFFWENFENSTKEEENVNNEATSNCDVSSVESKSWLNDSDEWRREWIVLWI